MSELNPVLSKNLGRWRETSLAGRRHGRAVYSRCLRLLLWANTHNEEELTTWRDIRPAIVDNFIGHRLNPAPGAGSMPVKSGTVARDVAALRDWLEWNEENELTGPIRSQYLIGRVDQRRAIDRFALSDDQVRHLLQRARWVQRGQRSLYMTEPGTGRRKAATATHWFPGAFYVFCRVGLELGLRPRELFWLAWEDFSEIHGRTVLDVRDHVTDNRVINELKRGPHTRRRLIVPPELAEEVEDLRRAMEDAGELKRFLFAVERPDKPGGWMKPEIHFLVKALKEELGEPRFKCNTLRKTCGQRLRRKGLDYFAIAQFLGHSATTCMRYYVQDCRDEEAFDPATCKPVLLRAVEG